MKILPSANDFRRVLLLAMLAAVAALWLFHSQASGAMDDQATPSPDRNASPAAIAPPVAQMFEPLVTVPLPLPLEQPVAPSVAQPAVQPVAPQPAQSAALPIVPAMTPSPGHPSTPPVAPKSVQPAAPLPAQTVPLPSVPAITPPPEQPVAPPLSPPLAQPVVPLGVPDVIPSTVDIFSVKTWQPPAPTVPVDTAPAPPPKPQAPPLPFRFLGKIDEPGKDTAYLLARGEQVLSVSVGERIGRTYLVEKHEGNRLYFIYSPLKVRQSIFVGHKS